MSFPFRGYSDSIPNMTLLLSPDTDNIKTVFPGDDIDKADYKVRFEGLERWLGGAAPCEIYLGKLSEKGGRKKQSLFWQLTGENKCTTDADKANMTLLEIAISINVGGELRGTNTSGDAGHHLQECSRPAGDLCVIVPVLVNNKIIEAKTQLLVLSTQVTTDTETGKKRPRDHISNVKVWEAQMAQANKKNKSA
jgi:hypothetical protein